MIRLNSRKTKEEQFSEKITTIQNKLYRLAYCYVKNEQEALDIVSEATYKGYIAYGKMDSMTYFDSWMSRIVINTSIDHIRRSKQVTYMEDHAQEFAAPERGASTEEKMDLYDALDRLVPEDRAYIILKFFGNMRFREIAEVLSLSENTVKSRFYRIINKLKMDLIEGEVGDL
ncbi:sigma-70 family RNA polymerase sigma factor [Paenibacillus sp. TSA_86.1]|uniref:sigma-70 family RNA polymerase sigma factor n=1 Tax=Paenibacillus sp. TSA_86.1 TaxID=3415649 RepID=UPI0040452D32